MIGKHLGHFRITARLGAGGMGEVYRAEDTKLGREVAVKVLPEAFVADAERLARFEREARVLASLNHPRIAGIFEVGEADIAADEGTLFPRAQRPVPTMDPEAVAKTTNVHYLVMELAPGETLEARIARGPLPVEEVLALGLQLAEGLEAAHERGVVHRDLKPGNVMVDEDGEVKILDFGLAKALADEQPSPTSAGLTHSPTLTARMTQAGVILGTAAYMSPEQARGQGAESRSDIWSLGVILWEMLSGASPFREETVSDTLAAVLKGEIDLGALPDDLPRRLRWLVDRCLQRDPRRRLQHVGEARIVLEDLLAGEGEIAAPLDTSRTQELLGWRRWLPTALGTLLLVVAGLVAWTAVGPEEGGATSRLRRFTVPMPNLRLLRADGTLHLALSPDGQSLVTRGYGGTDDMFYLRRLDQPAAVPLAELGYPFSVFFSPDGAWLGFRDSGTISKLSLRRGGVTPIARTEEASWHVTWSPDGSLYSETRDGRVLRIQTGEAGIDTVAEPDAGAREQRLRHPHALPSGRALLLEVEHDGGLPPAIHVLDLDSRERRDLGLQGVDPRYSSTGHLVYGLGDRVFAVPFDGAALEVTGQPTVLAADVWIARGTMQLALSGEGTMAYLTEESVGSGEPVLVSRSGQVRPLLADASELQGASDPRFSPDGSRVVFQTEHGLSVVDLRSNTVTRVTDAGFYPVWSPDGEAILHGIMSGPSYDLVLRYADLRAKSELFMDIDNNLRPAEWTKHGFVYREEIPDKGMDLKLLPADLAGEPLALLDDDADELAATISPDGRWLAFQSNRSGRDEVYVTAFPESRGHFQISSRGGRGPAWSPAGDELFYFDGEMLTAARLAFDPAPRVVDRTPLFSGRYHQYRWYRQYDVHPDGEHFLMLASPEGEGYVEIVLDWAAELEGGTRSE